MTRARYLAGLIGRGIGGSRSPRMHESEADAQGVRLVYALFDFAAMGCDESDLQRVLEAARLLGFSGLNVTHPYKQAVMPHLDQLSDRARRIGAVNTVAIQKGRLVGHNTDSPAFAESFRHGLADAAVNRVVQIGAGGAGAAVAHAMLELGVGRLTVHDQDGGRAQSLVDELATHFPSARLAVGGDLAADVAGADGVINATPMGMAEHPGTALPAEWLRKALWVADIVYFPLETALLAAARKTGCRTLDGAGMAVYQAARAFEIFTGRKADARRMEEAFLAFPN